MARPDVMVITKWSIQNVTAITKWSIQGRCRGSTDRSLRWIPGALSVSGLTRRHLSQGSSRAGKFWRAFSVVTRASEGASLRESGGLPCRCRLTYVKANPPGLYPPRSAPAKRDPFGAVIL